MPKRITSSAYWRKRETRQRQINLRKQANYDKEIRKIYRKAIANIEKEIHAFYSRYAKKEGITLSEAKKRADKLDIEAYAEKAKRYVATKDFSDQANEEMRLYNLTMKVNRLELLKANLGLELVDNFNDLQQFFDEKLTDRTLEEFKRLSGILGETVTDTNPAERAKVIVNSSFHNATWSDRIWMYQDLLKNELDKHLRTGLIQGRNPNVLARELRKVFDVSRRDAERLMHTELARVQTAAQKDSFERNDFEYYEFICCGGGAGTNPNDPCEVCKSLDGKQFKLKDMMIGENAPPVHPRCHCSTAAVFMKREDFDKWLDAKAAGETDLRAEEWGKAQESIEKSSDSGIIKKNRGMLKMNLQFFAEKDIKKQESNSLKRAIRNYKKRIAEHKAYINNPKSHVPDWDDLPEVRKNGLIRHWNKEIRNFNTSIEDRIIELKERGDLDE